MPNTEPVGLADAFVRILSQIPIPLLVLNPDYRLLWANPSAQQLFDLTDAIRNHSPLSDILPATLWQSAVCDTPAESHSKSHVDLVAAGRCLRLTFSRITDEDGGRQILATFEDMGSTPTQDLDAGLFDHINSNLRDYALILFDAEGRISSWNRGAEHIFGYSDAEIVGQPGAVLFTPQDRAQGVPEQELALARQHGRAADERWHQRRDGSCFFADGMVNPVWNPQGEIRGYIKILRDVTLRKQEQDALAQEHRLAFEQATIGIAHVSVEGKWLRVNDVLCTLLGYRREQLLGHSVTQITYQDDRQGDLALMQELIQTGRQHATRIKRYVRPDGELVWARLTISAMCAANAQVRYFFVVFEDVTEQKIAEAALRDAHQLRDKIMQSAASSIFALDLQGRFTLLNQRACELTGYSEPELLGQPFSLLFTEQVLPQVHEQFVRCAEKGETIRNYEVPLRRKDGDTRMISFSIVPLEENQGIIGLTGTADDVTERRQTEAALAESERRLARGQAIAHLGSWEWDLPSNELYWSDELYRIYGLEPGEMTPTCTSFLDFVHPEERQHVQQAVMHAVYHETFLHLEHRIVRRDGEERIVLNQGEVTHDQQGQPLKLLATLLDITERKHAEAEVLRLNEELERRVEERTGELLAANLELESFSYSVSHDLRAPLRAINGFTQAIQEDCGSQLDPICQASFQRVLQASTRMGMLIDDLLNLAQVTRGEIQWQSMDLSAMAASIASNLAHADPLRSASFRITPGIHTRGDARLLAIVLENLLGNAWKFTRNCPDPRIEFGISDKDGHPAYFVRDNGAGFDMDYAGRLFTPFQRLHGSNEFEGSGIGLATVSRIIRRHGGQVWAEGVPGQGATFYFTLQEHSGFMIDGGRQHLA